MERVGWGILKVGEMHVIGHLGPDVALERSVHGCVMVTVGQRQLWLSVSRVQAAPRGGTVFSGAANWLSSTLAISGIVIASNAAR